MPVLPVILSGAEAGTGTMSKVIEFAGQVSEFAFSLLDQVVAHPILGFFFAAGLIPLGLSIFLAFRNAASSH